MFDALGIILGLDQRKDSVLDAGLVLLHFIGNRLNMLAKLRKCQ